MVLLLTAEKFSSLSGRITSHSCVFLLALSCFHWRKMSHPYVSLCLSLCSQDLGLVISRTGLRWYGSPESWCDVVTYNCRIDWKIWRRPSSSWLNWSRCEECGVLLEVENWRPELRNRAYTEVPLLPLFFFSETWKLVIFYWGETKDLNWVGTFIRIFRY